MICTICEQDLPEDNFQTYYHSKQQVNRTRKQCTSCFYAKKNEYRYKMNRTQCIQCDEWKLKSEYPNYKALSKNDKRKKICLRCTAKNSSKKRTNRLQDKFEERVYQQPNRYHSTSQKETTFELMQALGWTFNEDTGIWSKERIKDKNNVWTGVITNEERKRIQTEKLKQHQEEQKRKLDKQILELFGKGNTIYFIEKQTGKSTTYIINRINEAQKESNID